MAEEHKLPPVVARMWGREPVSRRGPRPNLDLARITAAAIEIADAEGLAGVAMSSIASRLGVATMGLYRYVGSKDELLTAMVDAAIPEPPELGDHSWREYLAGWTRANRDFLLARPWLLSVARVAPPLGPQSLRWLDRALAALSGTTLDEGEKVNAATTLTGYAMSDATLVYGLVSGMGAGDGGSEGAGVEFADYGEILDQVLDPEAFPALSHAVRSGVFSGSEAWAEDTDFVFGLDLLLDGLEALIERRRR